MRKKNTLVKPVEVRVKAWPSDKYELKGAHLLEANFENKSFGHIYYKNL